MEDGLRQESRWSRTWRRLARRASAWSRIVAMRRCSARVGGDRELCQDCRAETREIRASRLRRSHRHDARLTQEVRKVVTVKCPARPDRQDVRTAHTVKVRSTDLPQIRTQLAEQNVVRREPELGARRSSARHSVAPDYASAAIKVFQSQVGRLGIKRLRIDAVALDRRDLPNGTSRSGTSPMEPSSPQHPLQLHQPRQDLPSSTSMSAMMSSGSRCSTSSCTISLYRFRLRS